MEKKIYILKTEENYSGYDFGYTHINHYLLNKERCEKLEKEISDHKKTKILEVDITSNELVSEIICLQKELEEKFNQLQEEMGLIDINEKYEFDPNEWWEEDEEDIDEYEEEQ